jgi:hypothetical protein
MEYHEFITACANNFNERINETKKVVESDDNGFDKAISGLNMAREQLKALEKGIKELKQVEHDLTQDVYNKFKDSGYSKRIKFV